MAADEKLITTVSTKGQVILPSSIRKRRQWGAGTRRLDRQTQHAYNKNLERVA
jgi:bifunctional DNA-binding transcriptional regulator/antitoxin component of YhaV-PrlF toxin-antitoxin module